MSHTLSGAAIDLRKGDDINWDPTSGCELEVQKRQVSLGEQQLPVGFWVYRARSVTRRDLREQVGDFPRLLVSVAPVTAVITEGINRHICAIIYGPCGPAK